MSDRKIAFWFIALLSVLVLVPFLGETIFYSKGEPREAIVAYTMLESGNWILPTNYGVEIAYKPPFLYWTVPPYIRFHVQGFLVTLRDGCLFFCCLKYNTHFTLCQPVFLFLFIFPLYFS